MAVSISLKRWPNDVSTSALNVNVTEVQTSVGGSRGRLLRIFKMMGIQISGCEIVGILKKFKDADTADSYRAPEWKRRQKSRVDALKRSSPHSMREDLENIYMLLFRFIGNGFQLALCNVGLRPRSPSLSYQIQLSSRRGRCCSTDASLVTAVKTGLRFGDVCVQTHSYTC